VFVHERGRDVAGFDHARRTLNLAVGTIGTLSLLVGSMLVVAGASALRRGRHTVAARAFRLTLACGAVFAAMKAVEYVHQATAGHTPSTNPFYMYFYVLSGIHLVHVAVATVLVMLMRAVARRPAADARGLRFVESAAIFWHLVDLLWLMLFALFYLMR
jgi:nitric oxide reductase NorE protein